ncbi:MAG TPA: hypothetical protein DCR77_06355 [Flavobacteriaceae bacterium]|nr:hypothetical protein [Flavobacteriaceae bacterium]
MLYVPCFKNVIKTEYCSLKELVTPTDFVWWFFTDEWKLFRSHFVLGFMERCLLLLIKVEIKSQRNDLHSFIIMRKSGKKTFRVKLLPNEVQTHKSPSGIIANI